MEKIRWKGSTQTIISLGETYLFLKNNPKEIFRITLTILDAHSPETMHSDILLPVGINDIKVGNTLLTLEVVHILWH